MSEVLFEFARLGGIVRVAAACPETLIEVVLQAPASLGRRELERLALRKLEAVKRRASRRAPGASPPRRKRA